MTSHDNRRQDLAATQDDPTMVRLTEELQRAYTSATPPPQLREDLLQMLRTYSPLAAEHNSASTPHVPLPRRIRKPFRLAALLGVVPLVLLGGTVLAETPLLTQVLSMWPGTEQLATQNLGTNPALTQSTCGFSMTINRVYAEANRVIVAYTLHSPVGRSISNLDASLELKDTSGHILPQLLSGGTSGDQSSNTVVSTFDASGSALTGQTTSMQLTVLSLSSIEAITASAPTAASCESFTDLPDESGNRMRQVNAKGPLVFNLTIPVDQRIRQATLDQTAQSSQGTTVHLDKIVVTATDIRIYLHGAQAIAPVLYVDGQAINPDSVGGGPDTGSEVIASYDAAVYDKHGIWLLKVLTDPVTTQNNRSFTGSVTFQIDLP